MIPTLQLLGRPAVQLGDETLEPRPSKVTALLLYLASTDGWVPRDDLLFLLWPDTPEPNARNSLRQLLHRAADTPWAPNLQREPTRARWTPPTDLDRFRTALEHGDLDAAIHTYTGPFLDGLRLHDSPEFDSWIELEREEHHAAWRDACVQRAAALRAHGSPAESAAILERVLRDDPLDEQVLRALMAALGDAGRRADALGAFDAFATRLEAELGVAPEPRTEAVATELRDHRAPSSVSTIAAPTKSPLSLVPLPSPSTPFVGRGRELSELRSWLSEEHTRLLTLVAPGGMGKTRLALALARAAGARYRDGAAFASFEAIERASEMESALADALGITLSNEDPPRAQIVAHLAGREALLVLDNLELVVDDLSLVSALLARCPELTIVATSRVRLGLEGETVYDVRGLGLEPEHGAVASTAAQLFADRAARILGRGDDASNDFVAIERIARAVKGMPLALTLAAGWRRVLSPAEIADELESSLDLLAGGPDDAPERHRSVRTVFEATWNRLGATEREAWTRLSLFEAPFDRESARAVANAGIPLLLALTNKAILIRRDDHRFALHPLLRQYGRERLASLGIDGDARLRHAAHCLDALVGLATRFVGPEQLATLDRVSSLLPDIRSAWLHAARQRDARRIGEATLALVRYGQFDVGAEEFNRLCDAAFTAFGGEPALDGSPTEVQRVLGRVLPGTTKAATDSIDRLGRSAEIAERVGDKQHLAWLHLFAARDRGRAPPDVEGVERADAPLRPFRMASEAHAEQARRWFREIDDPHGVALVDAAVGWNLTMRGRYDQALPHLEGAAASFRALGDAINEAYTLDNVVLANAVKGDVDRADVLAKRLRTLLDDLDRPSLDANFEGTLRILEMHRGDLDAAEVHQERYIAYFDALGADGSVAAMLRTELLLRRERFDEARREGLLALELMRQHARAPAHHAETELHLARIELRDTGSVERAREHLRASVHHARDAGSRRILLDTAVATAEMLWVDGRADLAAELAAIAHDDDATEIRTRHELDRLERSGLELGTPPDGASVALADRLEHVIG